ncbi:hypothetical protein BD560DRAFT_381843 [Blakeslea trispora]|nr:hypothetical protein BD560DRAFT_381843 [Blakeslea trispora]
MAHLFKSSEPNPHYVALMIPYIQCTHSHYLKELNNLFQPFECIDIHHDADHWYIVFKSIPKALQAQEWVDETRPSIKGHFIQSVFLGQHAPSTARQWLMQELVQLLIKDIQQSVIQPAIHDVITQKIKKQTATDQIMLDPLFRTDSDEEWLQPDSPTIELCPEWDPFYQARDAEDLEYMYRALVKPNVSLLSTEEKGYSECARTRGYMARSSTLQTNIHKSSLLGRRHRLIVLNKATLESDIIKFNQLKQHKKRLKLQKSPIHAWGLFADESIMANEMVLEFVGEVIRPQVAMKREREYKRAVDGHYLFRVDEETVLDATKKGNLARFINHCCSPNCSIKIVMLHQQKKVVICTNRTIEAGEEITYDYEYTNQTEHLPCLCGSKFCKGIF